MQWLKPRIAGSGGLTRVVWFVSIIALTGWFSLAAEPDRPNVVILFADDLGYGSVSWYGGDIPTPHIGSIAKNGIGFTSEYMTAPVCNPSRPGLMAGRYQQRWGKELNSQTVAPAGAPKKMLPVSEQDLFPLRPRRPRR